METVDHTVLNQTLPEVTTFRILPYDFDIKTGIARLHYAFDDVIHFTEQIDFGVPTRALSPSEQQALDRALLLLQVAAGVSYYKSLLPPKIDVVGRSLSKNAARFFETFYTKGLGEFAYRNGLDIAGKITFPYAETQEQYPLFSLPERPVVLFGGGKDSLVSCEVLKQAGVDFTLLSVNPNPQINACTARTGMPALTFRRTLDPTLFDLNAAGAYNGHVPITGILSFVALCGAFLHGYNQIVMSNERSANEGNLTAGGGDVNHQYSKSFACEQEIQRLIHSDISPCVSYFSLMRPFSELLIARQFAKITQYDDVLVSCNKNFRQKEPLTDTLWCRNCAKCRFTFLALATVFSAERLTKMFGGNMLDDPTQLDGFAALVGLSTEKPWDCVGEVAECQAALAALAQRDDWRDTLVVRQLAPQFRDAALADHLILAEPHHIPPHYKAMIDACVAEK